MRKRPRVAPRPSFAQHSQRASIDELGHFAGDLALAFGARGGVYLAGGLASNIVPLLSTPRFREAFDGGGPRRDYLKEIPIFAVKTGADANMRGAAIALARSLPVRGNGTGRLAARA